MSDTKIPVSLTATNRVYRSMQEKLELISKQKPSGKTVKSFCAEKGIHVSQFYAWKRQVVPTEEMELNTSVSGFIDITPSPMLASNFMELILGSIVRIRLPQNFNRTSLDSLLHCLKSQGLFC